MAGLAVSPDSAEFSIVALRKKESGEQLGDRIPRTMCIPPEQQASDPRIVAFSEQKRSIYNGFPSCTASFNELSPGARQDDKQ
jgi:hypothetical protein